jgi:hypothetical protein
MVDPHAPVTNTRRGDEHPSAGLKNKSADGIAVRRRRSSYDSGHGGKIDCICIMITGRSGNPATQLGGDGMTMNFGLCGLAAVRRMPLTVPMGVSSEQVNMRTRCVVGRLVDSAALMRMPSPQALAREDRRNQ